MSHPPSFPHDSFPDSTSPGQPSPSPQELIDHAHRACQDLRAQISQVIVGQDQVVEQLLISLFCRGHALLVGVPGLAKTLLISTISRTISLAFNRIQFTPDLMPSDITGTEIIDEDRSAPSPARHLRFIKGPVFANVILADEINRTPPKTQAALLEAMQEHRVTVGGVQHALPQPFFVLATQNPIEQEGTYPLPEAQLDRFLFMIHVGYPSEDEELEIVRRTTARRNVHVSHVLDGPQVMAIQALVRDIPVADHVARYALRLVRATRPPEHKAPDPRPEFLRRYLTWGAGPRASQALVLAAKARAVIHARTHATTDDIAAVAHAVLRHRLITNFSAEADAVRTDDLVDQLLQHIQPGQVDPHTQRQMNAVLH